MLDFQENITREPTAPWTRLLRLTSSLGERLGPLATRSSSAGGKRVKAVFLTAVSSGAVKIVSTATALISAPLTLHYLGTERFGLWMTLSSIVAILSFGDFGIGNGLLNAVAAGYGRNSNQDIRRAIGSALALLCSAAALIIVLFALSYPLVPWGRLVNAHGATALAEVGPALAVFVVCTALNIPAGLVQRVQLGLQRGFEANVWQAGGNVLGLVLVLLAIHREAGLPWLVAAMTGGPLLALLANGIGFFGFRRPEICPTWRDVSWPMARNLAGSGLLFLVLQLSSIVAFSSDNLIIAHVLGPAAVAGYALVLRLYAIVQQANQMLVGPLWPAYGEAIARGDGGWALLYFRRSMFMSIMLTACLSVGLTLCGPQLVRWWLGADLQIPGLLFLALSFWVVVEGVGVTASMFLYATGSVASQAVVAVVFSMTCALTRIGYVRSVGVIGIPAATLLCYCALALIPMAFIVRDRLAHVARSSL